MNNTFRLTAFSMAAAILVTACGGGGTTAATGSTPNTSPAASTAASLVTTVAPATYTGEFNTAFNLINNERNQCGFGLLSQNAQMDVSAAAHARYIVTNSSGATAHIEVPGQPGYTGVNPSDRMTVAGYSVGSSDEVVALGSGTTAIRTLMSGPYHLATLMGSYRDVGIGMQATNVNAMSVVVVDVGYQRIAAPQLLASSDVKTYPCDGASGVKPGLTANESPSPTPGRDLGVNPVGAPIYVRVRDGNTLTITNAGMLKVASSASVPLRAATTSANDPNKGYLLANEGYVLPESPLDPNSQYQVTITGTNNGVAFSRTFTFTTGANF